MDDQGFTEIESEGLDYEYDNNGNLVWDRNKGGKELLVNGDFESGNGSWVVSDVGSRLAFANGSVTVTSHASETATIRQNDIILKNSQYVVIVDMVRQTGNIRINVGSGGFTSINTSGRTVFTARSVSGDDFVVSIPATFSGEIKSIEVKGVVVVITYKHLNLPETVSKGPDQQMRYIYDATGRKISQEVFNETGAITKKSDYEGEFFYENDTLKFISHEEGRVVLTESAPEYQYHLKDHLGNVRLTFTTKSDQEESLATLETANENEEQGEFLYYDEAIKVNYDLFDHTYEGTTGATYYSTRLTGGNTNAIYGLAKSLSVMPGDTVKMEVFAKYLDPDSENWTTAMTSFMSAVSGGTAPPGTVIDGGSPGSVGGGSFPFSGFFDRSSETGEAPKAYLNFIVFDRNFEPIIGESGYIRITTNAKENGDNVAHDKLERSSPLVIKQAGYVYIYLSNENDTPVEVFFDDFRVEHVKSPVVQMDDYYPFGLTFNSYQRENTTGQDYLYQGKERQDELQLNTYDFHARMYDPTIGRTFQIDPHSDNYLSVSPYSWVGNNPLLLIDPTGMDIEQSTKKFYRDKNGNEREKAKISFRKTTRIERTIKVSNVKILNSAGENESTGRTPTKGELAEAGQHTKDEIIDSWTTKGPVKNKRGVETTVNVEWADDVEVINDRSEMKRGDVLIEIGEPTRAGALGEAGLGGNEMLLNSYWSNLDAVMQRNDGWDTSPGVFTYENLRVASHEFGHMGGLRHSPNSIMQKPAGGGRPPTFRQYKNVFRGRRNIPK